MGNASPGIVLALTDDKLKAFVTIRDEGVVDEYTLTSLFKDKDVKYGIDKDMLADLLRNPRQGTFVIARGQPPKQGKDGYVQYLFTARAAPQDTTEENIDFREIFNVPSVYANTVLAVYHPAVKEQDGITVTGLPIPANPVTELSIRAAKGATISEDGLTVTSTINGRPWARKQGRNVLVGVEQVYQHEGDVDIKSGNLRFNGDVVINGNVTENMIVDINGNLRVMGFISRATVRVTGNLEVMKVVTSGKINAGGATASLSKIETHLREIYDDVLGLQAKADLLMKNLQERQQNVQYGQVIMALLDKQYTGMDKKVQDFIDLVRRYDSKPPRELEQAIGQLAALTGLKALSLPNLDGILKSINEAVSFIGSLSQEPANITANSIWNSEVDATGTIRITGQGAFNSRVSALGAVEVNGVFRGGEIFARNSIRAREIGGPMGVKTIARTVEGSIIRASRLYNGSVVQIGNRIYTLQHDESMVVARINEHGDIVLH